MAPPARASPRRAYAACSATARAAHLAAAARVVAVAATDGGARHGAAHAHVVVVVLACWLLRGCVGV